MAPRTTKDRNTQRRKRRRGVEHKVYEMGKLCDFDVALIMYNPEEDEYYTYRSTDSEGWPPTMKEILARPKSQNKLPKDIERAKSKKDSSSTRTNKRKISRSNKRETSSEEVISVGRESYNNQLERLVTRAAPFLPEPPSFDLSLIKKKDARKL